MVRGVSRSDRDWYKSQFSGLPGVTDLGEVCGEEADPSENLEVKCIVFISTRQYYVVYFSDSIVLHTISE